MKANPDVEAAVMDVLQRMSGAYARRNRDIFMSLISDENDALLYGTGADEKRIGKNEIISQAERDWSQSESVSFSFDWTSVSSVGTIAWVAADVTFNVSIGETPFKMPARMTAVLQNTNDTWLLVQAHFSVPATDQPEGKSFSQKK